jgi:hypothetical protein
MKQKLQKLLLSKRLVNKPLFVVVLIAAGLLSQGRVAEAFSSVASCASDRISITSNDGTQPISGTTLFVTHNETNPKGIVHFSANVGVETGAEVRISYSVNGSAPQENLFGPANLANHQEFREARHVMAVIPSLPLVFELTNAIQPFWRVSGAPGKRAVMGKRCATVEP